MAPIPPMDSKPDEVPVPLSEAHLVRTAISETAVEESPTCSTPKNVTDPLKDYNRDQSNLWDDCSNRNIPHDGYDRVGVLMITWEDGLDQLRCAAEVKELEDIFKTKFHFEVRRLELHNRAKPQHQLSRAIASFVEEYDQSDSRNLMITYYSGHGAWNPAKCQFFFEATDQVREGLRGRGNQHRPYACWNTAEQPLWDSDSDILAIFDACLAARLLQRNAVTDRKTYEVLCASDDLTERPGPGSFTAALIKVLADLPSATPASSTTDRHHNQPSLTTATLYDRIRAIRADNEPVLWNRLQQENGAIRLAPVLPRHSRTTHRPLSHQATDLTLRFQLRAKRKLDAEDVDALTTALPRAFKDAKITCDRVSFVSHTARRDSMAFESAVGRVMIEAKLHRWVGARRQRLADAAAAPGVDVPVAAEIAVVDATEEPVVQGPRVAGFDGRVQVQVQGEDVGHAAPGVRRGSKSQSKSG